MRIACDSTANILLTSCSSAGDPSVRQKLRETAHEIEVDFDNIRLAWRYMIDTGKLDAINKSLHCLWWFLFVSNRHEDGVALFSHELPTMAGDPAKVETVTCTLLAVRAWFLCLCGSASERQSTGSGMP